MGGPFTDGFDDPFLWGIDQWGLGLAVGHAIGHEWVERQARKQGLDFVKQDNCFTSATDMTVLGRAAATFRAKRLS